MRARVRSTALLVLCGALAASPAAAQKPCPASPLALLNTETATQAATFDSSYSGSVVRFDLPSGSLQFAYCCYLGPTYMRVRDAYDITGVPAGTAVPVTVQLVVDSHQYDAGSCGGSGCCGILRSSVSDAVDSVGFEHSPTLFNHAEAYSHDVLELPVTIVAGTPHVIQFEFWGRRCAGGSHGADATGTIRFSGLAAGQSVISCQGFAGSVTPARRTTWGLLKTLYR